MPGSPPSARALLLLSPHQRFQQLGGGGSAVDSHHKLLPICTRDHQSLASTQDDSKLPRHLADPHSPKLAKRVDVGDSDVGDLRERNPKLRETGNRVNKQAGLIHMNMECRHRANENGHKHRRAGQQPGR